MPPTSQALIVTTSGRLDRIERPLPPLAPDAVRISVRYAGVGFADVMAVRGGYALAPQRPFSPGYEFFGTVVEIGNRTARSPGLRVGQRVVGMLAKMAAYQSVLDLDPRWVVAVPDTVSDETAALLPLNYLTAEALLFQKAQLTRGQCLVVHGAAGGVGSAVLELAQRAGLKAYGTASIEKHDQVRALGAVALDGRGDWDVALREREPQGVDAALDAFGGSSLERSWKVLARRGTLVSYGFAPSANGGTGPMLSGLLSLGWKALSGAGRRARVCGTPGLVAARPGWYQESLARILDGAAAGELRPLLHSVVPWDRVEEAHQILADRQARGKVLLQFAN